MSSRVCHLDAEYMIARLSAYANFLEVVVGKSGVLMLNKWVARTDPCGMLFLRCCNLLCGFYNS